SSVFAIYAQTSGFETVRFDDPTYVRGSVHLREGLSADGIAWAFSNPFASNYFPLTLMSHMFDRDLHGEDYGGHHITSVVIHAANSVLLFGALSVMTGALWPSAIVAELFAVHPLNVESVAWIAERKNVLSTTFWLLAMIAYTSYARRGGLVRYLIVASLLAAGLLAKPMLVTLPLVFLLLDYWPLGRLSFAVQSDPPPVGMRVARTRTLGFAIAEKVPLLMLSVASSLMTMRVQDSTIGASSTI
ncbi:unnamed protein product, partial [marine sediment metagenome]